MANSVDYFIIQAGGLGTRMRHLTANKPKALVSVDNLPIIFHLFRKYPNKKFIIIGDYKKDVLDNYLDAFSEVSTLTVDTSNCKGTCSGINNALKYVPPNKSFSIIWSDLVLGESFQLPEQVDHNYVGLTGTFGCRWSFKNNTLIEKQSDTFGVAGLFVFKNKTELQGLPDEGEFVRWLCQNNIPFNPLDLKDTVDYGLADKISTKDAGKCRPFNALIIQGNRIIKEGIDEQGKKLAVREKQWYKRVSSLSTPIPRIYSFEPFTLERINGKNIFEYEQLSFEDKKLVLVKIMDGLKTLHSNDICYTDRFSMYKAYFSKTFDRLSKIRDLVPFAKDEYIIINGKKCRNVFFCIDAIRARVESISCKNFCLIHGDCTFSNMMLRNDTDPVFIDPRGYFGDCELVGDPNYDWAKLYYSLVGNYDSFNLGKFTLDILKDEVRLSIHSCNWESLKTVFIDNLPSNSSMGDIDFIHALIWLSLTTYAWDDYDSICGAFYNGLYYMEDVL